MVATVHLRTKRDVLLAGVSDLSDRTCLPRRLADRSPKPEQPVISNQKRSTRNTLHESHRTFVAKPGDDRRLRALLAMHSLRCILSG